ncbi:hypothetical protein [Streptomyces physcomitrii]|uniref:Flagellar hook-length control protein FliK n=1 Tax=Streptomyces physcomitrii TaxID=2724184 RepID=A0ABX1H0W4_9ACTN|nr:hypothetical protein [Streptomyces physcomitrii]NKI41983.1 hypothetical protein [Streptomyces physcomitrii]
MRRHLRGLRAAALSLTLVAASAGLGLAADLASAPEAAAVDTGKGTAGFCPNADGVTVVVDFQELGGTTIVRCAPGDQATGLAALKNAGFQIAGTNRWGEGFICRIEGKPGPESEPCIDTPPASAYWSYWHAPNGGNWTYSQWGVMNRKPPPGSFEGWSFSKDKTSTTNPPPRVAPSRPAAGGSSGGSTGGSSGGAGQGTGGQSADGGAGAGSSGGGGTKAPATGPGSGKSADAGGGKDKGERGEKSGKDEKKGKASAGPSHSASDEPLPGTEDEPSEAAAWTGEGEDGLEPTAAGGGDGVPTSTVVGAAAVTVLAAGAGATAWRRRAARSGPSSD